MRKSTVEQYLKTINGLEMETGMARTKILAERLGVKPPSVSEFCRKLRGKGYISWEPYQGARLTDTGREIANRVQEKYEVIWSFLLSLGVEYDEAREQACSIEHEISDESVKKLKALIRKVD